MQEYSIDTHEWKEFWNRWESTIDNIPGLREELLKRVGESVQNTVRHNIDVSGLNDSRGRVKRWQNPNMGSRSGYVAVRADSIEVAAGYKDRQRLNAGALTNFLSSGHKVRGPINVRKRYQPQARMTRVKGADFYPKAKKEAEKIALQEAEYMLQALKEDLRL